MPNQSGSKRGVIAASSAAFVAGAVASWAIGALADTAVGRITDEGAVGADVTGYGSLGGVVVPSSAITATAASKASEGGGDLSEWADEVGGSVASSASLQFSLYGLVDQPVIITDIRATDVRCNSLSSDQTALVDEGGGNFDALLLAFDLRHSAKSVKGVPAPSRVDGKSVKWQFPRQVSRAEADNFWLDIQVKGGTCRFYVNISYRANGKNGHRVITNQGAAFVVSDSDAAQKTMPLSDFYALGQGG